jgi:hypothetical protein
MKTLRLFLFVVMQAFLMLWLSGCDHRPKVLIEGGRAPRFKLMGQGKIQVISVSGPDLERQGPRGQAGQPQLMKPYWEIVPNGDYDLRNIEERGPLVYGQTPEGFKQSYPADGTAPQPLFESGLFTFQLRTAEGNALGVRFTIHDGKALTEGS